MSQHLYISPATQVSIWPVVIIPRLNSGPIHFSFKTLPQGKIFLTKSLPQGHKFKGDFVVF